MKNRLEKILEYLIYLFIFLIPWQIVWIVQESFIAGFKWHQGTFLVYGTELLLWFIFLFFIFYLKKLKLELNKKIFLKNLPVFFLLFFLSSSLIWSNQKLLSFYWLIKMLEGIIVFFIITNFKISLEKISVAIVLAGVLQSVLSWWQFFSQEVVANKFFGLASHLPSDIYSSVVGSDGIRWLRAYGTFPHPNILGGFLAVCFIFSIYLYFYYKFGWQKILSLVALIFISTALFFSFSRSAFLALLVAYLFLFVQLILKKKFEIIKISLYLLFLLIFLFSAYRPLVLTRIYSSDRLEEKSIEQRVDSLSEAKDIIFKNPFLGVGVGNYTYYLLTTQPDFPGWHYQPAHNIYLMVLAELGIVGFLIFLFILLLAFRYSFENLFIFAILLVVFIIGFFDHWLLTSYFGLVFFAFILALALGLNNPVSFFQKVIRRLLLELSYYTGKNFSSPNYLSLITTFQCNFQCRTCDIWKKKNFNQLSLADWQGVVKKLKNNLSSDTFVEINGGEALLNKKLIINLIRDLKTHFKTVVLNTNGSTIDQEVISDLESVGLDKIKLSLYSLDSGIHNFLRGTDLAFSGAYRAVELIIESNIELEVGILVTSKNILLIPQLIDYLNRFSRVSIIVQPLDEVVESDNSKKMSANILLSALWPNVSSVKSLFSWLESNRKNIKNSSANLKAIRDYYLNPKSALRFRCFAGQKNIIVYPNGDLSLCFKGRVIGNLNIDNLDEVLKNGQIERKKIKNCKKYCRIIGCNFSAPIFRRR